jgi:hypothetical protein
MKTVIPLILFLLLIVPLQVGAHHGRPTVRLCTT